jgi:hypothetical protein
MMWINKSIYITCRNEYFTVDIMDNSIIPLVSYETTPLMRLLGSGELLLKQEKKGMLTDTGVSNKNSLSVQGSPLVWTVAPSDLVVHFPYVLSLQPDQIEVHSTFSWKLFQRLPVSPSSTTSTSNPGLSGLRGFVPRNTALVGYEELYVLAHSDRSIYALTAPKYPTQAESLVHSGNIEEGLFLLEQTCDQMRDYQKMLTSLHTSAAWSRFKSGDWKRAMVHFANAKTPPSHIIPSYPMLLLIEAQKTTDEDKLVTTIVRKTRRQTAPESESEKNLREACIYLTEYLESVRNSQKFDDVSHLQLLAAIFISKARFGTPGITSSSSVSLTVWKFLQTLSEAEISLCAAVFEHWCTVNRFYVLVGLLFRLRKLNRRALEEWSKISSGDRTCSDPTQTGIDESIALLQTLDDVELMEEFAPRIYMNSGKDSSKFLAIFASKHRTTLMPLAWIQSFLANYDKSILEQYLEFLVYELSLKDEKVETTLAFHLLAQVPPSDLGGLDLTNVSLSSAIPEAASSSSQSSTASSSSPSSSSMVPSTTYPPPEALQRSSIGPERRKLLNLLEQKHSYNAASILARIDALPLYHERIVLYERLGDHERALSLMVNPLMDFESAEAYCLEHEHDGSDALLSALLRIYLTLEPHERMMKEEGGGDDSSKAPRRATDLIERFPTRFRPGTVISTLPPDTPISSVVTFLIQSIRSHIALMRHNAVLLGIERSHNLAVTGTKMALTQRSFLITKDTTCPICSRPIQPGMFARYPNNVIVHVACMKNKHIDPVTGRNFYKNPQE